MEIKTPIYLLFAIIFIACGENKTESEISAFEATNKEETFVPLTDKSKITGVYHFGESEMESSLIINKSKNGYFAQLKHGSFNDEGTAWTWEYENFKNVRIEGSKFYSDKTNGEFLISEDAGTIELKVEKSWSYDGKSEMGYQTVSELKEFYAGDYPEASCKILNEEDIKYWTKNELKLMRNEIFARYGFTFNKGGEMDTYFSLLNWYSPQQKNVDAFLTALEKENISTIKKMESKAIDVTAPLNTNEIEGGLAGDWVCNSSKMFTLGEDGSFKSENFYNAEKGSWWLVDKHLYIYTEEDKDTVTFEIEHINRTKMVIANVNFNNWHEFFCETGSDYRIYSTLYKDQPIGRNVKNALVGLWYNSEGFELTANGEYIHHGPDCGNGTWDYKDGEIIINDDECGESKMSFHLLSTERLIIDKDWILYRMHKEENSIPTPKSKKQ